MKWDMSEEYLRVQKRVARRIYNMGGEIYLCPCKLRPGEPWHPEVKITLSDGTRYAPIAFDAAVSQFEFYNCRDGAGAYAAYYVERDLRNNVYESNG